MCGNVVTVSPAQHGQEHTFNGNAMFQLSERFEDWSHYSFNPVFCQAGPSPSAVEAANGNGHVAWLNRRKVKSFYRGVVATELRSGVNMLLQVRITPRLFSINSTTWSSECYEVPLWIENVLLTQWYYIEIKSSVWPGQEYLHTANKLPVIYSCNFLVTCCFIKPCFIQTLF